jgi:hypothetical protein
VDLNGLYQIITSTEPVDWYLLPGVPVTFLERSVVETGNDGGPQLEIEAHHARATYRRDISLGLAWGLPYERGAPWEEEWTAQFPDPKIRGYWADIVWNGTPIDRVLLLSVDGGRAFLPAPPFGTMAVHELNFDVARLVDGLTGRLSEFHSYFTRSGITVEQHRT